MLKTRVIPCLLLKNRNLVKSIKFKSHQYVGDAINTAKIFNELEVDELIFLDIDATREGRRPDFQLLEEIASECFMPVAYGGGIRNLADVETILRLGIEKVAINTHAWENSDFITEVASRYGSQSAIVSIDVKKNLWGRYEVVVRNGTKRTGLDPVLFAREMEAKGAGELLVTSVDRDGTWQGYDLELIARVADAVKIPVIANGGAGQLADLKSAVDLSRASACALGSMVVFQKRGMGVLVNFPERSDLESIFSKES